MLRRSLVWLSLTPLLLSFLVIHQLAAGGPTAADAQADTEFSLVHIYASDFDFVADRTIVPGGPIEFEMMNLSPTYKHEVFIYPIDQRDASRFQEMLDLKRTGQRADEKDFIENIVASSEIQAGDSTTFRAALPPGFYEIACLAREGEGNERMVHYDQGMFAAFAVRAVR